MQRRDCDVLVIGSGGAGLTAAWAAARQGARVVLITKSWLGRGGATIMAPGAIAAVDERWQSPGDSQERHIRDTLAGGAFVNHQGLVESVVRRAPELVLALEQMGAIFQREQDGRRYALRIDGGHSFPRCPFLEDRTGREMVRALLGGFNKLNIPFYEQVQVTRLCRGDDGRIQGAVGLNCLSGELCLWQCRALVLASGGAGSIYAHHDNPLDLTGDGYALALRAGAILRDMEFVQFYPLGFAAPPALKGVLAGLLYYGRLFNVLGERFMEKYDQSRLELSTRDRVARAMIREIREGRGGPNGGVYFDLRHNEEGFIARMTPALYAAYRSAGIDPAREMFEVAPTAHFFMGGLEVGLRWQSSLPGLWGAGEVCGGLHGANRLSQNALAEVLVSGMIAGQNAAEEARKMKEYCFTPQDLGDEEENLRHMLAVNDGPPPGRIRGELQTLRWENVGVIRSRQSLERAEAGLQRLAEIMPFISRKQRKLNRELTEALELKNMLLTARAVTVSARRRTESRGAHFREDYPCPDEKTWRQNVCLSESHGILRTFTRPADNDYSG
jgi:succinate dehydrogenase/fumarate reductase flavoprotein subunit